MSEIILCTYCRGCCCSRMYLRFLLMFNRAPLLHERVCLLAAALLSSLWLSLYSSLHRFTFKNKLHYFCKTGHNKYRWFGEGVKKGQRNKSTLPDCTWSWARSVGLAQNWAEPHVWGHLHIAYLRAFPAMTHMSVQHRDPTWDVCYCLR